MVGLHGVLSSAVTIQQLAANTIRVLSIDAVQRANSGHPGMPMGMADIATVLWHDFLKADPDDPAWPDRDRFVVSNGHGSMLLYSVLHLAGFDLTIDNIKNFRRLGHPTPGHPELDLRRGIETTTGPLGQGFGMAVGMAIAETHLRARFGPDLVDHRTYVLAGDGDLMEGLTSESASLAGHLALDRLTVIYDDNDISLEGPTSWTFTEDVQGRFRAYGWATVVVDGHDQGAIREALAAATDDPDRPTLVAAKTHIGYGSPAKQDTAAAHGSPLGDDEVAAAKEHYGWTLPPFEVPTEVYGYFAEAMERGRKARLEWSDRLAASGGAMKQAWESFLDPGRVSLQAPEHGGSSVATRALSGEVIQELAALRPDFVSGDADLAGSTKSNIVDANDFSATDRSGRNVRYGVREHAMGAAVNGINLHGGLRACGSTFFTFSDYMRPAVRLGALIGTPSIWVWTHDSVFLGEDGPTHQSVEHLAALRAIPNLWVFRPADGAEVAGAWEAAMNRTEGPSALVLSRQGIPLPETHVDVDLIAQGGYVRRQGDDATIVATGSEVWVAERAAELLSDRGWSVRVVSMPCMEAFLELDDATQRDILGRDRPRVSLEAAVTFGWARITGRRGLTIGIDRFGESAPMADLAEYFGFTPDAVADRVGAWLDSQPAL